MSREARILKHIDKAGLGLEIGPAHRPVAPKRNGYRTHVIDFLDREQLIAQHAALGHDTTPIEDVDFLWKGESYSALTGKAKHYDWVIASHVIEHVPDLIGFLKDCDAVLKDDGVISLVVPDKRYCFDHYRPITGISRIIDGHFQKATNQSPGTVAESFLNAASLGGKIHWKAYSTGKYRLLHSVEEARSNMQAIVEGGPYRDAHAWCFVPHSFRLMLQDLFALGFIPFREVDFHPTEDCEFFVTLGRKGPGAARSRLQLLEAIDTEVAERITLLGRVLAVVSRAKREILRFRRKSSAARTDSKSP